MLEKRPVLADKVNRCEYRRISEIAHAIFRIAFFFRKEAGRRLKTRSPKSKIRTRIDPRQEPIVYATNIIYTYLLLLVILVKVSYAIYIYFSI